MAAPTKVIVSLDPESKQLLKRVAVALEKANEKSNIHVIKQYLEPAPTPVDSDNP